MLLDYAAERAADRVEALDGLLLVTSAPGAGTVVTAEVPCAAPCAGARSP